MSTGRGPVRAVPGPGPAPAARLRVGMVGCGRIAVNHAAALSADPRVELVACCDTNAARAEKFASRHGVDRAYGDLEELLTAGLDAVTICTPGSGTQVLVSDTAGQTASVTEMPEGSCAGNGVWTVGGAQEYLLPWDPGVDSDPPLARIHRGLAPFHRQQIEDFVDAVLTGREPAVTGAQARHGLAVVTAVYESARTGRPVEVDPLRNPSP